MGETEFGNLWAATCTTYSSTALSKKRNQRLQGMSEVLPPPNKTSKGQRQAVVRHSSVVVVQQSPVDLLLLLASLLLWIEGCLLACLALLASPSTATWEPVGLLLVEGPQRLCPKTTTAIPTCIIISDNHGRRETFTLPRRTKKKKETSTTNPRLLLHPASDVSLFRDGPLFFEWDPVQ